MISGAAQADVAVLVVSARRGEFETGFDKGGQTREHALLAKTLGVNTLVVAINKIDDPTCDYSQERFTDMQTKMSSFLKGCGFREPIYVPISGYTGVNVKERGAAVEPKLSWWEGPSLLETLDSIEPPQRHPANPLRVPLLEGYRDGGTTLASGKVEAGIVSVGSPVSILPGGQKAKIMEVYVSDIPVKEAGPGENVVVKLSGIDVDSICRGCVLSDITSPCPVTSKIKCVLNLLELVDQHPLITAGFNCVLHMHTALEEVTFDGLIDSLDKKTKKKKKNPPFATSNQMITCILSINNAVCAEEFDKEPQLGRLTLRDEGKTIAIGKIVEIF
eukprot:GHVP01030102.1.p1 GENE.GHVP01030102.1~~GHVP01030102.1.p1  ORF type:complete len:332 (-),score=54.45 GHVP01030102.1:144-1139(-)